VTSRGVFLIAVTWHVDCSADVSTVCVAARTCTVNGARPMSWS